MAEPATGEDRLAELRRTYRLAFEAYDDVMTDGTPEERKEYFMQYNHLTAIITGLIADGLASNNPTVMQAHKDLVDTNKKIETMVADLKSISAFLKLLSQAVDLAKTVVALGA